MRSCLKISSKKQIDTFKILPTRKIAIYTSIANTKSSRTEELKFCTSASALIVDLKENINCLEKQVSVLHFGEDLNMSIERGFEILIAWMICCCVVLIWFLIRIFAEGLFPAYF